MSEPRAREASLPRERLRAARPHRGPALLGLLLGGAAIVALAGAASGATLTVDEAADDDPSVDDGACSLREAVLAANGNAAVDACPAGDPPPAVDEIVFASALDGTNLTLTIAGTGEDAGMTGDLDVTEPLTITGNGDIDPGFFGGSLSAATVLDGGGIDRVLDLVTLDGEVLLRRLALVGGGSVRGGAGIRTADSRTTLTLRHVLVTGNAASVPAGASTPSAGGGISALSGSDVVLENSAVFGNAASAGGSESAFGGGVNVGGSGDLTVTESAVVGNEVQADSGLARGGGIRFQSSGVLSLADVAVADNAATATGGTGSEAEAAGLRAGGDGSASIVRSAFVNNEVSVLSGGTARAGGLMTGVSLALSNSTVSENSADSETGVALGGGLYVEDGTEATLDNATVVSNSAASGGGGKGNVGGIHLAGSTGPVTLGNTALVGNSDTTGSFPDCSFAIGSTGYNILGDDTGCSLMATTGDQVGDVAGGGMPIALSEVFELGGATDNGGGFMIGTSFVPHLTVAPSAGSLAVDAGDPDDPAGAGSCETEDQRGRIRPADGDGAGGARCDVGAVELPEPGAGAAPLAALALLAGLARRLRGDRDPPRRHQGRRSPAAGMSERSEAEPSEERPARGLRARSGAHSTRSGARPRLRRHRFTVSNAGGHWRRRR